MDTAKAGDRSVRVLLWIAVASIVICLVLPVLVNGASPIPLLIGLLALSSAIAVPILLGRRRPVFMAVWFAVYVVAYGALSWRGGYMDGNFGGSDNRSLWYPAYCGEAYRSRSGRQKCSLYPLAWFFLPPIVVDRLTVHRTHFDAD